MTRAWCLFELHTAIGMRRKCDITIILSPAQRLAFQHAVNVGGYTVVDAALDAIDSSSAKATLPGDLAAIRAIVTKLPGGFGTLDRSVRQHLQAWFESQGGVAVGDRGRRSTLRRASAGPQPSQPPPRSRSAVAAVRAMVGPAETHL